MRIARGPFYADKKSCAEFAGNFLPEVCIRNKQCFFFIVWWAYVVIVHSINMLIMFRALLPFSIHIVLCHERVADILLPLLASFND